MKDGRDLTPAARALALRNRTLTIEELP